MIGIIRNEDLERKVRYPKASSIILYNLPREYWDNSALKYHLKEKCHHRLKYEAKYLASKQSRRLY